MNFWNNSVPCLHVPRPSLAWHACRASGEEPCSWQPVDVSGFEPCSSRIKSVSSSPSLFHSYLSVTWCRFDQSSVYHLIFHRLAWRDVEVVYFLLNLLTPNVNSSGRTAPLTSKRWILYIYSTNIGSEYFKHSIYSPFFSLQNAVCFIILTYLVPVLFTFYIQGVPKFKKK